MHDRNLAAEPSFKPINHLRCKRNLRYKQDGFSTLIDGAFHNFKIDFRFSAASNAMKQTRIIDWWIHPFYDPVNDRLLLRSKRMLRCRSKRASGKRIAIPFHFFFNKQTFIYQSLDSLIGNTEQRQKLGLWNRSIEMNEVRQNFFLAYSGF
ncbi:hypothetical protein D1872_206150 [compost metagenome]